MKVLLKTAINLVVTTCLLCATSHARGEGIRCDQFDVQANLKGERLEVQLNTDCPDYAEIMVSISRIYYEIGSDTAYSHDYFHEKSTVYNWRKPRQILVSHSFWTDILEEHRKKMNRLGLGYTVDRVEENIRISMILPNNQKDERFGERNKNLVGKAIQTSGWRIAESEIEVPFPFLNTPGSIHLPSTAHYSLERGVFYRLSKQTPLMPTMHPSDPMGAIANMKYIPTGYIIEIVKVMPDDNDLIWYNVIVWDSKSNRYGPGYINSIALIGQELESVKLKDE